MNWSSYYVFWLAAPLVLSLVSQHPAVLLVAGIAFLLRSWLPDPYLYFKYARRIDSLRRDIETNPHNAAAQRELASIYLDKRRPGKAIALLEAALARDPDSVELTWLHGRALLGARRWQEGLDRVVAAVNKDPKLAYGEPYLRAGDALMKLERFQDAEDAFERAAKINASSVEGRTKLGLARLAQKDEAGAKHAFNDARTTYRQLPGFQRRKQWRWSVRAWWGA